MNIKRTAIAVFVAVGMCPTLTLASSKAEFETNCPALTAEHNPEVTDVDGACSCVTESASDAVLSELVTASGPDALGKDALEALRSCGYGV